MFFEMLTEKMKELGWSQNYFSGRIGINRGLLQRYKTGDALLPADKFRTILEEMPLSGADKERLGECYFKELFGEEKYSRIKYIEKSLFELDNSFERNRIIIRQSNADFSKSSYNTLSIKDDVVAAAMYILDNTACGRIITNYPYSFKEFDDALFLRLTPTCDYTVSHLVLFDKENVTTAYYDNFFKSIRWLANQINPLSCYAFKNESGTLPFPYYLTVEDFCLLFSDGGRGMLVKDKVFSDFVREAFEAALPKCFPMAIFPKNMIEYKDTSSSTMEDHCLMCISHKPCLAMMGDRELINSVIRKDVPGIEMLAEVAVNHYAGMVSSDEQFITTAQGLSDFTEHGKVPEIPSALVHEVPLKQRIRYFKLLIERLKQGKLKIIDDEVYHLFSKILFDFYDHAVMLGGPFENCDESEKHTGQYIVRIFDKIIMQDLYDFAEYMKNNAYFYSEKMAESFLSSQINLLEEKARQEK